MLPEIHSQQINDPRGSLRRHFLPVNKLNQMFRVNEHRSVRTKIFFDDTLKIIHTNHSDI